MIARFNAGSIPDYQISAWLMAACLRGLDRAETDALTRALLESGRVFDWTDLGRPSADKHSTDTTTIAASSGVKRRDFLKVLGAGTAATTLLGCA